MSAVEDEGLGEQRVDGQGEERLERGDDVEMNDRRVWSWKCVRRRRKERVDGEVRVRWVGKCELRVRREEVGQGEGYGWERLGMWCV